MRFKVVSAHPYPHRHRTGSVTSQPGSQGKRLGALAQLAERALGAALVPRGRTENSGPGRGRPRCRVPPGEGNPALLPEAEPNLDSHRAAGPLRRPRLSNALQQHVAEQPRDEALPM